MLRKCLSYVCLIAICLGTTQAFAFEPASFDAGAFKVTPLLGVTADHDNNVFLTRDNEFSSSILRVNPRLGALAQIGANTYTLNAEVIDGSYASTHDDDYTDWRVGAAAELEFTSRHTFSLGAEFFSTHENRGTGFSQGGGGALLDEPDEFEETTYDLGYQFGADESLARLALNGQWYEKEYDNHRAVTVFRDREESNISATLYFDVLPSTDILFEYTDTDIDYNTDPLAAIGFADTLDSTENYAYVGVEWEVSALTTGILKLGYGEKDFADPDRADFDIPSWELGLRWSPLTYSTFSLNTRRGFDEATGIGNAIDRKEYSVGWQHTWSPKFNTVLTVLYSEETYEGTGRDDDLLGFQATLNFTLLRWLDIKLDLRSGDRDSSFFNFNYDQEVVSLGFEASF